MRKERTNLVLRTIKRNDGQLEWLPRNPRQWTQTDIDNTARSIAEDEDFLEDRPLLVTPDGDGYVVFAGNLRREGAKKQKMKTVPAVVYYPETDEDRLTVKRRAMKDNGSFGAWDYDALANEWDDLPLGDWGVPSWKEEEGEPIDGTPAPTEEGGTSSGTPFNYEAQYGVIVTCRSEEEQMGVYNRLTGEGYECKVVSV